MPNPSRTSPNSSVDLSMTVQPWSDSDEELKALSTSPDAEVSDYVLDTSKKRKKPTRSRSGSPSTSADEEVSDYVPEIPKKRLNARSHNGRYQKNASQVKGKVVGGPPMKKISEMQYSDHAESSFKPADLALLRREKESLRTTMVTKQRELQQIESEIRQKDAEILREEIRLEKVEAAQRQKEAESRIAAMEASLLVLDRSDLNIESMQPEEQVEVEVANQTSRPINPLAVSTVITHPPEVDFEQGRSAGRASVTTYASADEERPEALPSIPTQDPVAAGTKLSKPLSELTKDKSHVPLVDVESFVHRSTEVRQKEMNNAGRIKRPLNAFMLYRKAYQNRTKDWCLQNDHQVVSQICGESWQLETKEIKERFAKLAIVERDNHNAAHPDYKFSPRRNDTEPKEVDFSELKTHQCKTCKLTWILGIDGAEAGKSHPSHHSQSQEWARSLLVVMEVARWKYRMHFYPHSKFNIDVARSGNGSPPIKEKAELVAVLRTLEKFRLDVLPARMKLIKTTSGPDDFVATDKGAEAAMKMRLVIATASLYAAKALSAHSDIWVGKGRNVAKHVLNRKADQIGHQLGTREALLKVTAEISKLSQLGVKVTFHLADGADLFDFLDTHCYAKCC